MSAPSSKLHQLDTESVGRIFLRYLIPSTIGMLLMAINIVADGIMVGNRLGAEALAGVGIAAPVYTIFFAISLWIGIGAATKYSMAMGAKKIDEARTIFTHAILSIFLFTLLIGLAAFIFRNPLAYALGANSTTFPFVSDYLFVILLFGFIFTVENTFSIFVRNDGAPNLSMAGLIVTSVVNIVLNYIFLFIFDFGVSGAAFATIIASFLGMLVLASHFFKKTNNLKLIRFSFNKKLFAAILVIGFPSFLSELGISVFTISHNIAFERAAGTEGVAAFSILNYVHSVMLMLFLGMGGAIQPLISYYHGAGNLDRQKETIKKATWTVLLAGAAFFLIGQFAASPIVSIFGDFPKAVRDLASTGINLFFIAYLFTGTNFVMMTYYQSVGNVRMATWITASREIIVMLVFLLILPRFFGLNGIWLAIPASEFLVFIGILLYQRKSTKLL
ncbi:MATE family efflux transporter [Sporosarcina newyorkensis]|uniref:Multidrug export protein MepA n=1 Tax=Sporosarcina newyorkensis TaxID=759851 RepID=A0A1T4YUR4_9BACL|nr:MATE family efflux transporter [Sporosarcina newyorkensis]SKB05597.1 putative efflux protein, MATE family [Sporosarcina newyorkensis]